MKYIALLIAPNGEYVTDFEGNTINEVIKTVNRPWFVLVLLSNKSSYKKLKHSN